MGKFGIILTRRYLLYIVLTLTCGMAIYLFILTETGHNHEVRPITGLTWSEFRKDCGYESFINDPQRAINKFDRIYQNQGVSWDGYIIRISLNEEDAINFAFHSTSIMFKMDPED
jgi:hypothetical protein